MYWKVAALLSALILSGCALNPIKAIHPDAAQKAANADKKAAKAVKNAEKADVKAEKATAKASKAKAEIPKPERKELEVSFWLADGQAILTRAQQQRPTTRTHAKGVILFIGDGMGASTITAARILATQQAAKDAKAGDVKGEEGELSFETFPATALAKTYNTDLQTPESAGAMSAIMTGVKTRGASVAVGPKPSRGQCREAATEETPTLIEQAKAAGLGTGLVTTARVTHAVPAATYAHVTDRDWEVDAVMPPDAVQQQCVDIARQLARSRGLLDIVLGGGRIAFLPAGQRDPIHADRISARAGGENLIDTWRSNNGGEYITTATGLSRVNWDTFRGPLLGLFAPDHMAFEADRAGTDEPSLTEMTVAAIKALKRNPRGYVLVVDAGGIDRAHHNSNAYRALTDTIELSRAVQAAADMTKAEDTLIIVTADHSSALTLGGYPKRGNPILGVVEGAESPGPQLDASGRPYTTLGYSNGPIRPASSGPALTDAEAQSRDYHQVSGVPLSAVTHGGEDVPIYARGPGSQWVHGTLDQHAIYWVMRSAALGAAPRPKPAKLGGVIPAKLPKLLPFAKKPKT